MVSSDRWEHSQIGDATPQILKFAFMAPLLMNAGRAIAGQGIKQMGKVGVKQGLKNMASKKGLKELASSALEGKGKEMAMDAVIQQGRQAAVCEHLGKAVIKAFHHPLQVLSNVMMRHSAA